MRTVVEIVARPGPGGRTVLPVMRASGQLAVRRTGPVHPTSLCTPDGAAAIADWVRAVVAAWKVPATT